MAKTEGLERTEKLLAMILVHDMKDAPQGDKALALNRAGFSATEIAALLGATTGTINQQLYLLRKRKAVKKAGRKKR